MTPEAAYALAWQFADAGARLHEVERNRAAENPMRVPLDLAKLIPIPDTVLEAGFEPDGERWLMAHWGTPAPLRRVASGMELRRCAGMARENVGVFRFVAENWAPWLALRTIQKRWPALQFTMRCQYGLSADSLDDLLSD